MSALSFCMGTIKIMNAFLEVQLIVVHVHVLTKKMIKMFSIPEDLLNSKLVCYSDYRYIHMSFHFVRPT